MIKKNLAMVTCTDGQILSKVYLYQPGRVVQSVTCLVTDA